MGTASSHVLECPKNYDKVKFNKIKTWFKQLDKDGNNILDNEEFVNIAKLIVTQIISMQRNTITRTNTLIDINHKNTSREIELELNENKKKQSDEIEQVLLELKKKHDIQNQQTIDKIQKYSEQKLLHYINTVNNCEQEIDFLSKISADDSTETLARYLFGKNKNITFDAFFELVNTHKLIMPNK